MRSEQFGFRGIVSARRGCVRGSARAVAAGSRGCQAGDARVSRLSRIAPIKHEGRREAEGELGEAG